MSAPSQDPVRLLSNAPQTGDWRLLRFEWPPERPAARPGQWLQLELGGDEYPLMIRAAAPGETWLGLSAPPALATRLAALPPHSRWPLSDPHGAAFEYEDLREPPVLLGSGIGMTAILFLASVLRIEPRIVLLGGDPTFPFRAGPSRFLLSGLPPQLIAAAPMLEAQGIASRLAHGDGLPGCFEGSVVDLLRLWLASRPAAALDILACVPAGEAAELHEMAALGGHRLQMAPLPPR